MAAPLNHLAMRTAAAAALMCRPILLQLAAAVVVVVVVVAVVASKRAAKSILRADHLSLEWANGPERPWPYVP